MNHPRRTQLRFIARKHPRFETKGACADSAGGCAASTLSLLRQDPAALF